MDRDRRASRDRDQFLCNAWMRYPSFFMLMTAQPFFVASSWSA